MIIPYTIHHGQIENLRLHYMFFFISGVLTDQKEYNEHLEMSRTYENYSSTKYKDDRLHLSNISFAGPVVLGIVGKIS